MERQKYIPPFKENPSRRIFPSRLMLKIFPTETIEVASSFQEINEHMHNGYGVVITYNHISLSDHIRIIATCITNVKSIAARAIVSPIAEHQYNTPIINFCRETHVALLPIITPHTIKKYREQGKSITDKNICRKKYKNFILNAHDALSRGGSVFIAPQGEENHRLAILSRMDLSIICWKTTQTRNYYLSQQDLVFQTYLIMLLKKHED